MFWKLFELSDSSEENKNQFWQKVELILTYVKSDIITQAVLNQTQSDMITEIKMDTFGSLHVDIETCQDEKFKYYNEHSEQLMKVLSLKIFNEGD